MIDLQNIGKQYGANRVLDNVSLSIGCGEFFVLVGPSGSGKSTLLKMLNRLIEPDCGRLLLRGGDIAAQDLRTLRLSTGYVLQQIALFPNMTVEENIGLIPEMKGWGKEARRQRARELLEQVGLPSEKYLCRYPRELSGGEQQRVGILRAIAAEPQVLLMDEPFSALDPISRRQLQDLIKELHQKLALTVVFVTHDMKEALHLADRICILNQGKVVRTDTPEGIMHQPENALVADLFAGEGAHG